MKRLFTLFLALVMMLSCLPAMAEYDKHITFTTSLIETGSPASYTDDAVYHAVMDQFNMDFEVWPVTWDNWTEKDRVWINGGTMPDLLMWQNFNYSEYLAYVDQGLISPLPDGWEEDYPALYDVVMASGIADKLYVDGKIYAIPRTTLYQFAPVSDALAHNTAYYRKDWAEELGFEFDEATTLDELVAFAKACIENDMAGNGNTLGISADPGKTVSSIMYAYTAGYNKFVKTEDGYVWGPTMQATVDGFSKIRELYDAGIIDPDFYLHGNTDPKNNFATGLSAVLFENGPCTHYVYRKNEILAAQPDIENVWDMCATTTITDADGVWHGIQSYNYWTVSLFSPTIEEETQRRILDLMEYTCSRDVQTMFHLGIKDQDWKYGDDGELVVLRAADESGALPDIKTLYGSIYFWYVFTVLADDFTFVDPSTDVEVRNMVSAQYAFRGTSTDIILPDTDYDFYVSDAKDQYSLNIEDAAIQAILAEDGNVAGAWQKFVDDNRPLWEPLLDELNAEFYGK